MEKEVIFGIWPVIEALREKQDFNQIFIQTGLSSPQLSELKTLAHELSVPLKQVPIQKLNRITRKNHQGIIGMMSPITYGHLENLVPLWFEEGKNPLVVILDGITDVRNFGGIARTCECMGADALIIPRSDGVSVTSDALRTSTGALAKVPVCREDNLKLSIEYLKASGYTVVGVTEKASDKIGSIDLTGPVALILGNEERGIQKSNLQRCSELAKIEMFGTINSLNVSVAVGMALYEATRQRI